MIVLYPLISGISLHAYIPVDMNPAFFKHPEIMFSSLIYVYTNNSAIPGYDQLCFVGVSLLFS